MSSLSSDGSFSAQNSAHRFWASQKRLNIVCSSSPVIKLSHSDEQADHTAHRTSCWSESVVKENCSVRKESSARCGLDPTAPEFVGDGEKGDDMAQHVHQDTITSCQSDTAPCGGDIEKCAQQS
jgi:hypothetical protein